MSIHEEAKLILKLYELRRDETMRKARSWFAQEFFPDSMADIDAAMFGEHSGHLRMVCSFWDMASALVHHGAINAQLFSDTNGEHLVVFSRMEPFLKDIRSSYGPAFLLNLEKLIDELNTCKHLIADWDTLLFSVFYHDIIYNVLKSNNEEKSADLAVKRLSAINFPKDKINTCREQIIATKSHLASINKDTNLFTDADLSILGQPTDLYVQYCAQIRNEYSIYPDIVYKPGRKKVVTHFLNMEKLFKTSYFSDKYELQAKKNLESELNML